jgi:hypothetical protein
MRSVYVTLTLICTLALADCATERLGTAAPQGVNLTGEWNFNPNLSDDPNKLVDPDTTPQRTPGTHHGHAGGGRGGPGGGGGGAIPPMGGPGGGGYNYLPISQTSTDPDVPATQSDTPRSAPHPKGTARFIKAPAHMSITQQGDKLVVRSNMPDGDQTEDTYTAGTSGQIPYGQDSTAQRSVGWRGPVFVIDTDAKKIGWREDQFALDDEGHLIMTTDTKGGRLGTVEIKRVYDRVRGAGAN